MFLNDKTVLRFGLFEGTKLASRQQGDSLALCRFGPAQTVSLVAIGQNLDKLLVFDLTSLSKRLLSDRSGSSQEQPISEQNQQQQQPVSYISIRDRVIETVTAVQGAIDSRAKLETINRDLLLIGCNNCIMVYDTFEREHLFSVQTSSRITTIASDAMATSMTTSIFDPPNRSSKLLFCGGVQKLYAYHLDCASRTLNSDNTLAPSENSISFECSNERTISETVSCLIWGQFGSFECLVAGFHERRIKVFTVDLFDQSVQMCRLTLTETARVNCLCAIETVVHNFKGAGQANVNKDSDSQTLNSRLMSDLPSIIDNNMSQDQSRLEARDRPQMNYFAYGLENGTVGVYRLLAVPSKEVNEPISINDLEREDSSEQPRGEKVFIFGERLWRHRSEQAVVALSLFDIDGDGQDELIVGHRNGRLEVRSPFTGQLIARSRCFKTSGQQLVGLLKWSLCERTSELNQMTMLQDAESQGKVGAQTVSRRDTLLACSSTSSIVALKPKQRRPHQVLIDYLSGPQPPSHSSDCVEFDPSNFVSALGQQQQQQQHKSDWPPAQGRHLMLVDQDSDQEAENASDDDDGDQTTAQGINKLPLSCECKQNPELLQQISFMKKRQEELRQKFNQIQCDLLRSQLASNQAAFELFSGGVKSNQIATRLAHCWNFDAANNKLLLTLVLEPVPRKSNVAIEMIEIQDIGQRLLPTGHMIIQPVKVSDGAHRKSPVAHVASDANRSQETSESLSHPKSVSVDLVLGSHAIACYRCQNSANSDSCSSAPKLITEFEPIELKLRVYLAGDGDRDQMARPQKRLWRSESASFVVQTVLERTIAMPKFAMFVPESLIVPGNVCVQQISPTIRKTFALPERANKFRILDWINSHFLCFQFQQLIEHENQLLEIDGTEEDVWAGTARSDQLEAMRLDTILMPSMRKFSLTSYSTASETKELDNASEEEDNEIGFEYKFVDLETLEVSQSKSAATVVASARRFRLIFSPKDRRLTLESNDSDLLVDVIQMLIIDRLQLSVSENAVNETATSDFDGVEVLLKELETINENSRQLEESERRIETEIYESAELVKSLMQQLSIANELKEYGISRELLAEISMMLNGTQNSAQAFNLNNRTRLNLMKQANCLREKVSFLTGNEKGERVS